MTTVIALFTVLVQLSCDSPRSKALEAKTPPQQEVRAETETADKSGTDDNPSTPSEIETKPVNTLNFFFENSGSMNGYVTGHYEIKTAISRLLSQAEYNAFNAYLINTQLHNFKVKPEKVTSSLTPSGINKGDISTSDLNFILKTVLDSTAKSDIGVLVTDGIYSVSGDANDVLGKLQAESNFTARHFEDRLKKDKSLQTVLIKLTSRFNGQYYPVQGKGKTIDQQRPYYLWIIGSASSIASIQKNLRFSEIPQYKNHIVFNVTTDKPVYYSIVPAFMNKGTFRQHQSKDLRAFHITHAEKDRRSKDFQFAVSVDMRNIPVENSYLLNKNNYEVLNNDDYTIAAIHEVSKLTSTQKNKLNNPKASHIIVLHSNKNPYGTLNLALKKQLPAWVKQTNSLDDTNIQGDEKTTLGFSHLVGAIDRAYNKVSKTQHYINLPLTIQN